MHLDAFYSKVGQVAGSRRVLAVKSFTAVASSPKQVIRLGWHNAPVVNAVECIGEYFARERRQFGRGDRFERLQIVDLVGHRAAGVSVEYGQPASLVRQAADCALCGFRWRGRSARESGP